MILASYHKIYWIRSYEDLNVSIQPAEQIRAIQELCGVSSCNLLLWSLQLAEVFFQSKPNRFNRKVRGLTNNNYAAFYWQTLWKIKKVVHWRAKKSLCLKTCQCFVQSCNCLFLKPVCLISMCCSSHQWQRRKPEIFPAPRLALRSAPALATGHGRLWSCDQTWQVTLLPPQLCDERPFLSSLAQVNLSVLNLEVLWKYLHDRKLLEVFESINGTVFSPPQDCGCCSCQFGAHQYVENESKLWSHQKVQWRVESGSHLRTSLCVQGKSLLQRKRM